MKYVICLCVMSLFLLSCGNNSRQTEPIIYDDNPIVEQVEPDTVATAVQNEESKVEEKPSVPTSSSSSSRSHKSSSYDNMRGFDPASPLFVVLGIALCSLDEQVFYLAQTLAVGTDVSA